VVTKRVAGTPCLLFIGLSFNDWMYISAMRLVVPMILDGLTALSVDIITNLPVPKATERSATFFVPKTLANTASDGFSSIIGTCLYAAAWKTTSGW